MTQLYDLYTTVTGGVFYRISPSTNNPPAGSITQGNPLLGVEKLGTQNNQGINWTKFRYESFTYYVASKYVRFVSQNIVVPEPPAIIVGEKINLLPFIFGKPGKTWRLSSNETLYWDYSNPHHPRLIKNKKWEGIFSDGTFIKRKIDVSPEKFGGWLERFYTSNDHNNPNAYGVNWIPVEMAVGETYRFENEIQFYKTENGKAHPANSGYAPITIKLAEVVDNLVLNGVDCGRSIILEWYWNEADVKVGNWQERWTCSEIFGYIVRWQNQHHDNTIVAGDLPESARHAPEWKYTYGQHYVMIPNGSVNILDELGALLPTPPQPPDIGIPFNEWDILEDIQEQVTDIQEKLALLKTLL